LDILTKISQTAAQGSVMQKQQLYYYWYMHSIVVNWHWIQPNELTDAIC